MNTYNVSEFANLIGVTVKTLQRWDREGRLVADRTVTNRRVYTDDHLAQALGRARKPHVPREMVAYIRVSTRAQKPDLQNQRAALEAFCLQQGLIVDTWIEDYGSGLNFKRKGLLRLVNSLLAGRVEILLVAHQDRLARFGFELIAHLCQLNDCTLLIMNDEQLSPEAEMVQDVLAILHVFSARLYGLRSYRKQVQEALHATSAQDPAEPHA